MTSSNEPVTRNKERTQALILAAATDEFAENGFGGARIENMALRSGVNKRMLYYYYKDKEDLFLAVIEQAYRNLREAEASLNLLDFEPEQAIEALVRFTWRYHTEHREFLHLLNAENLCQAVHLRSRARMLNSYNTKFLSVLEEVLRRGEQAGLFRKGVDVVQFYISLVGLSYFYLSNNATMSLAFSTDLNTPKARAQRLEHILDMVMRYLRVTK